MRFLKTSAVVSCFALPLLLSAQSFPKENSAAWRGMVYGLAGPIPFAELMCGDTTINTLEYNKIHQVNYNLDGSVYNAIYHACTRVDGQKVWVIAGGANQESLLYDFSVQVGDTLHLQVVGDDWDIDYYVESVGQIMIEGVLHKKIQFQTSYGIPDVWIEGVGSIMGPLGRGFFAIDAQPSLTCFLENGEVIYKVEDAQSCQSGLTCSILTNSHEARAFPGIEIFPNPANTELWVRMPELKGDFSITCFNAGGQQLFASNMTGGQSMRLDLSHLTPGFYWLKMTDTAHPGIYQYHKIAVAR